MGQRRFGGTSFQPRKLLENAATPTRRVHALLACDSFLRYFLFIADWLKTQR
jgi:hypothetical protein